MSTKFVRGTAAAALSVAAFLLLPVASGVATSGEEQVVTGFANNAVTQGTATATASATTLSALGAEVDRVQINWKNLEPTRGGYKFGTYDQIYAADLARGVRPLFVLGFAPGWAATNGCAGVSGTCHAPPAPSSYDDYARTLAVVADRYPNAAGVEVWNEPNLAGFWRPAPDPAAYAALLEKAYAAVKAVEPSMPVAGASLAQTEAAFFLRGIYDAGAADSMDAISMHAYAGGDRTGNIAVQSVEEVRDLRDQSGDPSKPIWITETGASTTGPNPFSELAHAAVEKTLLQRLSAERDVEMVLFHSLFETNQGSANRESGFGVMRRDFSPKPAACALALELGGWLTCPAG